MIMKFTKSLHDYFSYTFNFQNNWGEHLTIYERFKNSGKNSKNYRTKFQM